MNYRAPPWLPSGHLQTIVAARLARSYAGERPVFLRERWDTPDGDFIDVDWLAPKPMAEAPLWVMFHGLEGSSSSHYALACADYARRQGIGFAVAHFRGCSGELNWAPRAYHSGDYEEIGWVLQRFASLHSGPICAIGISLGGNALLRWAEEAGHSACATVRGVAAVCSPLDLAASGAAMGRGFNRQVYTRMFLRSMKPKALAKLKQHPGLFDAQALMAAQDLYAFDNIFTAPLHGFRDTEDYWKRASAKPHLAAVRVPALAISARNDPFIPTDSLPAPHEVGQYVHLQQFDHGGHVGFAAGMPPGHLATLPQTLGRWFDQHAR
jgi:predicted alpha/beta-fold hydrolase